MTSISDELLAEMLAAAQAAYQPEGQWGPTTVDEASYRYVVDAERVIEEVKRVNRHVDNCDPGTIAAIITELQALRRTVPSHELREWQPIETAPKGRAILLAGRYEKSGMWDIQIGCWVEHRKSWPYVGQYYPTHWMPLPAPPKAGD